MTDGATQNVVRPWPIIVGAAVAMIFSSAGTAFVMVYKTAEQVSELKIANAQQVSGLNAQIARLDGKIEALTTSVNNTEKTGALIKNTLDEGIRQQLAGHERRIILLEQLVDSLRRASDVPTTPGRR